ncbi:MAG: AMP-binding protein, partial [Pollutimonas bauzanensis]
MLKQVKNLGAILRDISARLPSEPGFIKGSETFSWLAINQRVDAMAHALSRLGIGKGDRILVHSGNNVQLFESAWVAFKLGAVWVPTNVRITEREIAYLASSSKAAVMIYDAGYGTHADACLAATDTLKHMIASALDLVLQIGRMADGKRRILAISEVL